MQKKNDLFVITKTKDIAKYIITVTEKSPKKFRYTLTTKLQNFALDALEYLYLANTESLGEKRENLQKEARTKLSLLDYFAGLAAEQECILFKQYEFISKEVASAIMYLDKWRASDKKRVSTTVSS